MKVWVNEARTVLVRHYGDGREMPTELEIATRPGPGAVWGPPIVVRLERGARDE